MHPGTLSGYLTGSQTPRFSRALAFVRHPFVRRSGLTLEDVMGEDIPPDTPIWNDEPHEAIAARLNHAASAA